MEHNKAINLSLAEFYLWKFFFFCCDSDLNILFCACHQQLSVCSVITVVLFVAVTLMINTLGPGTLSSFT